jgi:hypothetical protein
LCNILVAFAGDSLMEIGKQINGAEHVLLSCNKANKKGLSQFVKILSWRDKTQKKHVEPFILDINMSEGTLGGCTEATKHSMKKR